MNIGVGQDFLVEPVVVEECGEHQDLVDGFVDQHGPTLSMMDLYKEI
jgi:hypothetical protein